MRILFAFLVLTSISAQARENYLFECNNKAVVAAKAIDAINFNNLDRSDVRVFDNSQKKKSAKTTVSFGKSSNRAYKVFIQKQRGSIPLRGIDVEELNCIIKSVKQIRI